MTTRAFSDRPPFQAIGPSSLSVQPFPGPWKESSFLALLRDLLCPTEGDHTCLCALVSTIALLPRTPFQDRSQQRRMLECLS